LTVSTVAGNMRLLAFFASVRDDSAEAEGVSDEPPGAA
jgi:hypothetical protein